MPLNIVAVMMDEKKMVYTPFGIKPIIKKRNVTSYCAILFAIDTSTVSKMHYFTTET
jgi:hypothetical protein